MGRWMYILPFLLYSSSIALSQHSEPSVIQAVKINEKIRFDGLPDETVWAEAPHITNFTQRDLDYGKPVSERTEVAVLYDENTLYFGIWCYQKDVRKIVAKEMIRDFDYESDDNFQIMISPFNDNRTGYLFVVNPNGARADVQIYGGEDANDDWNGVWDVKANINKDGWFAELYIPFSSLQFKNTRYLNWAINFERDIISKNEAALWQGWSRDNSIYAVNKAGKISEMQGIAYAKKFEFKPYALLGKQYQKGQSDHYPLKFGADMNVSLSPTLKLNLTTFTDFAQVEADRIPVNLSRFSVYYPEKRQFFLEGSDKFNYYLGDQSQAFHSREIGIEDGKQIPIVAGARLFGKIGKNDIGLLNIQEASFNGPEATNNTVIRYKHEVGKQSYIGGIFTNKMGKIHSNQVIGVDATYQTSEFLKNKNIVLGAKLTNSMNDLEYQEDAFSYRVYVDYPNDLIDNFMAIGSMQKGFNPGLGYIHRSDYDSYSWYFRLAPRVFTEYGIKRLILKPWGFTIYNTHSTGELESFHNETRPLGMVFKTGDRFEINLIQDYDRMDKVFEIDDGVSIPTGKYMMYQYEIELESYQGRRLQSEMVYLWGDFYTGKIKTLEMNLGVNINKHFNLKAAYVYNLVDLPQEVVKTNEIALYANYAFTTKLNFSFFSQYNDLEGVMMYNLRLHWIPKLGSDLYFVYNAGYDDPVKKIDFLKPHRTDAAVKIVYRFVF
jgi:hypothetical protein